MAGRTKKNPIEKQVIEEYRTLGYDVLARGWPDLLVFNDEEVFCVEIKRKQKRPSRKTGLSVYQKSVHQLLRRCGLKVIVRYDQAVDAPIVDDCPTETPLEPEPA